MSGAANDLQLCDDADKIAADDFLLVQSEAMTSSSAIYYPFVVWVLGVLVFFLLKRIPYLSSIPYAGAMFLLGSALGMGAELNTQEDDLLTISILQWVRMDGSLLLLVFLPGLIFRDAIEVDLNLFFRSLPQLLLLALPMVLVGTGLVAVVCVYTLPSSYNFSWALGATLGSILSSTDPIAVAAVLNEARAPVRLKMLIAGESLLNDGAALVFYSIFSQIYLSPLKAEEPIGWAEGIKTFFKASLGGLAMGIAFAMGLVALLYALDRRLDPEYNILQVVAAVSVAFMSYFTADLVQMSGIISCVFCGIGSAWFGKGIINDAELMDSYLKLMEHMLNSLLFSLGGSIWGAILVSEKTTRIEANDWAHLIAFYLLVSLIRFFQVALFYPILSRIGLKCNPKEAFFLAFGGLRGAVGIALALSLFQIIESEDCTPESYYAEDATRLVFLSGGISLATLLINGTAAGWVIQKLGLAVADTVKTMEHVFEGRQTEFVNKHYGELIIQKRFAGMVEFDIVKAHVSMLTRQPIQGVPASSVEISVLERRASASETDPLLQSRIDDIASSRGVAVDDMVVQLRFIFLDMLKEAYVHAASAGQLVEGGGGNRALEFGAFRHSVEFAEAEAKDAPLNDWAALQMFKTVHDDPRTVIMDSIFGSANSCARSPQKNNHIDYKEKRARLLRAVIFIEGHERVSRRLEAYINSIINNSEREEPDNSDTLQQALDNVLRESCAQVAMAREVEEEIPTDERKIILSHYVATIILTRLIKMIEESATDGLLQPDEARSYISRIEQECLPNHHIDGDVCECLIEYSKRQKQALREAVSETKEA